jgi:transcription initiation factor TFIIIB Brf1 subunit/transcription initiation factor TFIIB
MSTMSCAEYFGSVACENCGRVDDPVVEGSGDVVCRQCGLVRAGRLIDSRSEEIIHQDDRDKGNTMTRTSGFDTVHSYGSDDVVFAPSSGSSAKDLERMQNANSYMADKKHKLILAQLREVNEGCSRMNVHVCKVSL